MTIDKDSTGFNRRLVMLHIMLTRETTGIISILSSNDAVETRDRVIGKIWKDIGDLAILSHT